MLVTDMYNAVKSAIDNSGMSQSEIARKLGITRQGVNNMFRKQKLTGEEAWIRILDVAGYDVEIVIKKKTK